MEAESGEFNIIHKQNEDLGFLKLLISVVKDAVDAVLDFHKPFRLAENEFGMDPVTVLFWWSLKKNGAAKISKIYNVAKTTGTKCVCLCCRSRSGRL